MWQDIVAWLDGQCIFNLESVFRYTSIHNFTPRPVVSSWTSIPSSCKKHSKCPPSDNLLVTNFQVTSAPWDHQEAVAMTWTPGSYPNSACSTSCSRRMRRWSGYFRRYYPDTRRALIRISAPLYLCSCRWHWSCTRWMSIFSYFEKCWLLSFYVPVLVQMILDLYKVYVYLQLLC